EQLKVDQLDQLLCLQEQQQQQRATGASSPGHNHSNHPQGAQKHRHQEEEALENCQNSTERHDEEDGEWFLVGQCSLSLHRLCPHYNADLKKKKKKRGASLPIQAGKQTFEEMLEEQLRLEEQRLKSAQQQQVRQPYKSAPPKRAFLRRGEGLSRFTRKSSLPKEDLNGDLKPSSQARVVTRTTSENGVAQRLPVQRKTATMNKENRPRDERDRRDVRVEMKATRTKVLGCHQRQNTGGEVRTNKQAEESKTATKQADARALLPNVLQESPETSLVEKLRRWECERHLESMELGEFELLEQAADELSFSSNSSFVSKVTTIPDAWQSSSEANNDAKESERVVDPSGFPSSVCYPVPSEPPYDKRSYQDDNGESEDVLSSIGDDEDDNSSTLEDDKDATPGQVVFDDDTTWNETDDTAVSIEPVDTEAANQASDVAPTLPPPPNSKLMMKLFPALKPKTQNAPLPLESRLHICQQCKSTQLRERLVELEIEIERFKKENAALAKLRQENEENQENLRKERLAWEQERAEQLARFEEYKREETGKLQRERKVFEKHASAARAVPDKKEREEIQALKQQLSSLQEDLRKKESRWSATHGRLRQQIDSLGQENNELRDEVRMLEKLRLSALKNSVATEKDVRHGPSVSKGVTFAVSTMIITKHYYSSTKSHIFFPHTFRILWTRGVSALHMAALQRSLEATPLHNETKPLEEVITHPDGKVEKVLAGGDRVIVYPNGTTKQVSCDGTTVKVNFFNGDTKEVTADHRVLYYYADTRTTHITYPDGMEVLHFPNNQIEKHFPDGRKEITFADQTVKTLFPDGSEESVMTDGTVVDGTKEIHFNTGQKEVHTADYKRREYPDGTVKTVYADGRQETRYPGGRLRVKDKHGNVLTDERQ
uniref:Centromere protein J n=1 Tax=Hippocampus comes TaxID=109280 RepID=A0A3Q3DKC8_HIPCM